MSTLVAQQILLPPPLLPSKLSSRPTILVRRLAAQRNCMLDFLRRRVSTSNFKSSDLSSRQAHRLYYARPHRLIFARLHQVCSARRSRHQKYKVESVNR
ncbi:unnamed protein product [Linum trigynum]|uniref:Uncharacterized protein n=1 Tax=Linum trigynum TaxID=586398 RepID=A0AAV2ET94_9ROSI